MVGHSDRRLADQYLRRERREGRAHATWPEESDPQGSTTAWVRHYAEAPETRIGTGTGLDRRRAGAGCRYPLGRGGLEDMPQSVRDTHSAQEDQWDSPPESLPDDSDEESDNIVAYDTTTSRYTTRTE